VLPFLFVSKLEGISSWAVRHAWSTPPTFTTYERRSSFVLFSEPPANATNEKPPKLIILIPAYNEEYRIESTLKCYQDYLLHASADGTDILMFRDPEIVVVDDGSLDATVKVVQSFPKKVPIRTVTMEKNSGKGAALAKGIEDIFEVKNTEDDDDETYILTQDADGSGDLMYLDGMLNKLRTLSSFKKTETTNGATSQGLVVGNRNYNLFTSRGITRWGFQTCVRVITGNKLRVKDSQCGYKLMTLKTAIILYKNLHLKGWSHDVEVLYRANLLNIPIDETRIEWEDMEGSKITESGVVKVSIRMLLDVIRLRWNYSIVKSWRMDA